MVALTSEAEARISSKANERTLLRVMDEQGAQTLVSVWQQLGAANAKTAELEAKLAKAGSGGGSRRQDAPPARPDR